MKTTQHFEEQLAERGLERNWVERVVQDRAHVEEQKNGRLRIWGYVSEIGGGPARRWRDAAHGLR